MFAVHLGGKKNQSERLLEYEGWSKVKIFCFIEFPLCL